MPGFYATKQSSIFSSKHKITTASSVFILFPNRWAMYSLSTVNSPTALIMVTIWWQRILVPAVCEALEAEVRWRAYRPQNMDEISETAPHFLQSWFQELLQDNVEVHVKATTGRVCFIFLPPSEASDLSAKSGGVEPVLSIQKWCCFINRNGE